MRAAGASLAEASYQVWDTTKWFVSSEGSRIDQRVRECGAAMSATAIGDGETQRRSYPGIRGQYGTRGWELVRELDLPGHAARIAEEAQALLTAPECPAGETTLILGSEQMALQIHESVGHATELDRILGWEAAYAGTSWLDLAKLGQLQFGSELMTITADATLPGALGSFGYDDEGVPAQRTQLIKDGIFLGYMSGRESAAALGDQPTGASRADGWQRLPLVRMTNICLEPGESSLEEMIGGTKRGILVDTNRGFSIDDQRMSFRFTTELGGEIRDGKLGRLLKNCSYQSVTPQFWAGLDALGGPDEWKVHGVPSCNKGEPLQVAHVGHGTVPGRFQNVQVGR